MKDSIRRQQDQNLTSNTVKVMTAAVWLLSCTCTAFLSCPLTVSPRPNSFLPITKEPVSPYSNQLLQPLQDFRPGSKGKSVGTIGTERLGSESQTFQRENSHEVERRTGRKSYDVSPVCRVVARSSSMLPMSHLTDLGLENSTVFSSLDAIYHASAHEATRQLQYMQQHSGRGSYCAGEDEKLVSLTRAVLEDAGFQRLTRRDIDLCDALNAGYLLRLSLLPDTKNLQPGLFAEFYPELVDDNGNIPDNEELLFDGRILVFWRGYSEEVSQGRLIIPKIDYLQASLVQRSAAWLRQRLNVAERWCAVQVFQRYKKSVRRMKALLLKSLTKLPRGSLFDALRQMMGPIIIRREPGIKRPSSGSRLFTFSRYGGSRTRFMGSPDPMNALNPFIVCTDNLGFQTPSGRLEESSRSYVDVERRMQIMLNKGELQCPYDEDGESLTESSRQLLPPKQLLKRVSLGSLVDLFSKEGRKILFRTLISKSKLVEPTFKEVVVIWRPQPKKDKVKPAVRLPTWMYDVADMFDIEGLPPRPPESLEPALCQLELRAFTSVPMANLPAVLPKTKLIFRPADAFVFDSITLLSLTLVVGSLRFDNPRLDLLALVSVALWFVRTFFRYSNKLARYDLLVKTFLTSKITHRNMGALKYVATEAGSQRAIRAAMLHRILLRTLKGDENEQVERDALIRASEKVLSEDLKTDQHTYVDIDAGLSDLEDLKLVRRIRDDQYIVVRDSHQVLATLKQSWCNMFEGQFNAWNVFQR